MKVDLIKAAVYTLAIPVAILAFFYLAYLFVSVIFLGGSSACPQNFCP